MDYLLLYYRVNSCTFYVVGESTFWKLHHFLVSQTTVVVLLFGFTVSCTIAGGESTSRDLILASPPSNNGAPITSSAPSSTIISSHSSSALHRRPSFGFLHANLLRLVLAFWTDGAANCLGHATARAAAQPKSSLRRRFGWFLIRWRWW